MCTGTSLQVSLGLIEKKKKWEQGREHHRMQEISV